MALFRVPGDFSSLALAFASSLVQGGDTVLVQDGAYHRVVIVPFDRAAKDAQSGRPKTAVVAKACVRLIRAGGGAAPSLVTVRRYVWECSPVRQGNRGPSWLHLKGT